jgi:lipopolysaccharide biosynthesis glycosyltransferase
VLATVYVKLGQCRKKETREKRKRRIKKKRNKEERSEKMNKTTKDREKIVIAMMTSYTSGVWLQHKKRSEKERRKKRKIETMTKREQKKHSTPSIYNQSLPDVKRSLEGDYY